MTQTSYDIAIVGSGIVGLVNALLLAKQSALRIAILDAKIPQDSWSPKHYDSRVYAITPASQGILQSIDAWPSIQAKRLSTFKHMQVWDELSGAELAFDHVSLHKPALGYIVEENLIRSALLEKIKSCLSIELLCPLTLSAMTERPDYMELHLQDNPQTIRTHLLIGADGAQSWIREQAGIGLHTQAYEHTSLIAQVRTEQPHQETARQVFLSGPTFAKGPLAFLPLSDSQECSIVWSTAPEEAEKLLNMDESAFQELLSQAFSQRLGKILAVSKRQTFPLHERHAEKYVQARLALIGDAAHTLHPLAGQGVNLGIADAAALAEVITTAFKKGRDFASLPTLRPYERARKSENTIMLNTVKVLKGLFLSENKSLQGLRSQGMKTINQFPLLKNFFASYAMG